MIEDTTARPLGIHLDDAGLTPRKPLAFARQALGGACSPAAFAFMAAWAVFTLGTSAVWALHLRALADHTGMTTYWGEILTARDLWELAQNGGLAARPLDFGTALLALAALLWVLWSGWGVQAGAAGLRPRLAPWLLGLLDALAVGLVPLGAAFWVAIRLLQALASTGIQGFGWLGLVLGSLLKVAFVSAVLLQWWLCRIARATGTVRGLRGWLAHLYLCGQRLWTHPLQWGVVVLGGAALRAGLHLLVLAIAWRMGGGALWKVWLFLGLQLLATLANAWLLVWILRITALFWEHEEKVRAVVLELELAASQAPTSEVPRGI